MNRILIIEDKKSMADMLKKAFEMEGFNIEIAHRFKEAIDSLSFDIDAVVTDLKLPDGDGLDLIKIIKDYNPSIPIIVMTAYGSIEKAVKAVKDGAYDFLTKPFDPEHLILVTRRAIEEKKISKENKVLKKEFQRIRKTSEVIGVSDKWKDVMERVRRVAPLKTTVLILGESGTGKEVVARTIHNLSSRSDGPFIAVNCAAIPKELIESEMFGHEKGAFTGANDVRQGYFELADKGTIFLDEIADMDMSLQSKLLRILESGELQRIGSSRPIKIDVRIIAASNKNLKSLVDNGRFREDLFFRLNVFPIVIPPLRERKEDIIPLSEYFLKVYSEELGRAVPEISKETNEIMLNYEWKGNVRELKNVIERALILCDSAKILPEHLNLSLLMTESRDISSLHDIADIAVRDAEKKMIEQTLRKTGGNKSKAAELLKISYKTLLNKIKEYGIG
jgi:DNA-binding NtrC family response regulator